MDEPEATEILLDLASRCEPTDSVIVLPESLKEEIIENMNSTAVGNEISISVSHVRIYGHPDIDGVLIV